MSNMIVNIRFGTRHFVIRRGSPRISFGVNQYWVKNKLNQQLDKMFGEL